MNSVALYFASGESLYLGAALLLLLIAVSPFMKRPWLLRLRNLGAWLALAMVVMACPPFALVVDLIFLTALVLWFIAWNRSSGQWLRSRTAATAVLGVLVLLLAAIEFSHRKMPVVVGKPSDHLVVIGDSISSGIDPRVPSWPLVLQETTGIAVKNLARPGAQSRDGLRMAEKLTPEDHVVLIEIGGNDLLEGVPSEEFRKALDALRSKASVPGRMVVMFELPLFPHRIAYGRIQRGLAAKYGVWLIPKRFFTEVIGGANATSDGLHLSSEGTRRMAALVVQALSPVLKSERAN
ncbi:MAG TPA: GDSL-type esterase/lipase family protein [Terriglobales bacterium]|nr:GDSL-type esterase/lipase family protein [Terriglobales bacterium]